MESNFSNEVTNQGVTDTDEDGMPDIWEIDYFGNMNQDGVSDYDGDGLSNVNEYQKHTDPTNPDTDSDQMPDGWEVEYGLNPKDAADADSDI